MYTTGPRDELPRRHALAWRDENGWQSSVPGGASPTERAQCRQQALPHVREVNEYESKSQCSLTSRT